MEKQYERILTALPETKAESTGENERDKINIQTDDEHGSDTLHKEERSPLTMAESGKSFATSPPHVSPTSYMKTSSFGFSDDEDEDEAELKRYNLDFSVDASDRATLTNSLQMGSPSNASLSNQKTSFWNNIWYNLQSQRQEARQRRAQLLLQQSEHNFSQSLWIFLSTYCDATDRGIVLAVSLLLIWTLLLINLSNQTLKIQLFAAGSCFFSLRIGARPLWVYCTKQRQKRRRQRQQQRHQQLPQQSPIPESLRLRSNSHDGLENVHSPSRYLDVPSTELQSIPKSTTKTIE